MCKDITMQGAVRYFEERERSWEEEMLKRYWLIHLQLWFCRLCTQFGQLLLCVPCHPGHGKAEDM